MYKYLALALLLGALIFGAWSTVQSRSTLSVNELSPTAAPVCTYGCWHTGITTTYEQGGAAAGSGDMGQSNRPSAWYRNWSKQLCGTDKVGGRALVQTGCDNLYYFALPCSDYNDNGPIRDHIRRSPWRDATVAANQSWFKNRWIEIRYQGKTVYAQWEDVGPMGRAGHEVEDCDYVFGTARPKQESDHHALSALDISPLAFKVLTNNDLNVGVIQTDWRFIETPPAGDWTANITTTGTDW